MNIIYILSTLKFLSPTLGSVLEAPNLYIQLPQYTDFISKIHFKCNTPKTEFMISSISNCSLPFFSVNAAIYSKLLKTSIKKQFSLSLTNSSPSLVHSTSKITVNLSTLLHLQTMDLVQSTVNYPTFQLPLLLSSSAQQSDYAFLLKTFKEFS